MGFAGDSFNLPRISTVRANARNGLGPNSRGNTDHLRTVNKGSVPLNMNSQKMSYRGGEIIIQ